MSVTYGTRRHGCSASWLDGLSLRRFAPGSSLSWRRTCRTGRRLLTRSESETSEPATSYSTQFHRQRASTGYNHKKTSRVQLARGAGVLCVEGEAEVPKRSPHVRRRHPYSHRLRIKTRSYLHLQSTSYFCIQIRLSSRGGNTSMNKGIPRLHLKSLDSLRSPTMISGRASFLLHPQVNAGKRM